jgi:hypothetical protein
MKLWKSCLVAMLFAIPEFAYACDTCCTDVIQVKCCHRRRPRLRLFRLRRIECCCPIAIPCCKIYVSPPCDNSGIVPPRPGDPLPEPSPMPPIVEPPPQVGNPIYTPPPRPEHPNYRPQN